MGTEVLSFRQARILYTGYPSVTVTGVDREGAKTAQFGDLHKLYGRLDVVVDLHMQAESPLECASKRALGCKYTDFAFATLWDCSRGGFAGGQECDPSECVVGLPLFADLGHG